jgi:hypothetical protein
MSKISNFLDDVITDKGEVFSVNFWPNFNRQIHFLILISARA